MKICKPFFDEYKKQFFISMPIYYLTNELFFPHPNKAEADGMLAVGGDVSIERLLLAYRMGIFPWPYSDDYPLLWASPNPRLLLFPHEFKVSKSLSKTIQSGKYTVKIDTSFEKVIRHCAEIKRKGQKGTWITEEIIDGYINLHKAGYAHSFETFLGDELVGGLYGVSMGWAFFGESMFHLQPDASKVALYKLVEKSKEFGFHFIDSQVPTEHMKRLGAIEMSRNGFLLHLRKAMRGNNIVGKWTE